MSRLFCTCLLSLTIPLLIPAGLQAADPLALQSQQDGSSVVLSAGSQPVLKYRYGDAPFKPYLKELYTPGGVQVLRDSPADHVHHRSVMFGIFANGVDFWSETPACGKQVHAELAPVRTETEDGTAVGTITQRVRWLPPHADRPLLIEQRTIKVRRHAELKATLVTWQMRLQPGEGAGTVKLTGNHYDGLGMRFVPSMDGVGRFLYASDTPGPLVRGTERVTPDKWAAYTAPADGKTVTAAIFDDPKNVRSPAGMFTMLQPFSYLSATPNVWKTPLELPEGQPLELRYGVAVWDGEVGKDQIEALYQRWLRR